MRALPIVSLLACACSVDPPPGQTARPTLDAHETTKIHVEPSMGETEGDPFWELERRLAGGQGLVQSARGLALDGRMIVQDPLGPVVIDARGARFVVAERLDGGPASRLLACAPPAPCRVVVDQGSPDRAAIAPDGQQIAWVASVDGLPAVFVAPFDGGAPTQLTNVGLSPGVGGPPNGFVEPPHGDPLRFEGGALAWDAPGGAVRVVLP